MAAAERLKVGRGNRKRERGKEEKSRRGEEEN
jgi:hypothetical protein